MLNNSYSNLSLENELNDLISDNNDLKGNIQNKYIIDKNKLNTLHDKYNLGSITSYEKDQQQHITDLLRRRDQLYNDEISYGKLLEDLKDLYNSSRIGSVTDYNLSSISMTIKQKLIFARKQKEALDEQMLRWNIDVVQFDRNPLNRSNSQIYEPRNSTDMSMEILNNDRTNINKSTSNHSFVQLGNSILYPNIQKDKVDELNLLEKFRSHYVDKGQYDIATFIPLEQRINS